MEKFPEIVKLMDKNPAILQMLKEQTGSKKETKKSKIQPGQVIEMPVVPPTPEELNEPTPIPLSLAKKLLKTSRKPRTLSEESRAKMLANLQKGREALQQKKRLIQEIAKKEITKKRPATPTPEQQPTAKYIVQAPKPKKPKVQAEERDYNYELQQNEAMLKKIEQMQQSLNSRVQPRMQQPVATKKAKGFSLFF
jgi:hypothetical protein